LALDRQYRRSFRKVGIVNFDDLFSKNPVRKRKLTELALRPHPEGIIIQWDRKKPGWFQLKGIGVDNLRVLEAVGIDSISALARKHPEFLYDKIETRSRKGSSFKKQRSGSVWRSKKEKWSSE